MKNVKREDRIAVLVSTDTVGERIKKARIARNVTQTELSKRTGTVYQRIHEWEASWKNPSIKYLDKIAAALDINAEWLKTGAFSKEPYCVYKKFYCEDEESVTEEQFEEYKDNLEKAVDYLISTNEEDFDEIMDMIENRMNLTKDNKN